MMPSSSRRLARHACHRMLGQSSDEQGDDQALIMPMKWRCRTLHYSSETPSARFIPEMRSAILCVALAYRPAAIQAIEPARDAGFLLSYPRHASVRRAAIYGHAGRRSHLAHIDRLLRMPDVDIVSLKRSRKCRAPSSYVRSRPW